jgi:hypothetical protein
MHQGITVADQTAIAEAFIEPQIRHHVLYVGKGTEEPEFLEAREDLDALEMLQGGRFGFSW